jgi:hypothetical protein
MPDYERDEEKDEIGGGPAQEAANVIAVEHGQCSLFVLPKGMGRPRAPMASGTRFGRLTTVREVGASSAGGRQWLCRCDCGTDTIALVSNLRRGATGSCGCLHRELLAARMTKHGDARRGALSAVNNIWRSAKDRCHNPRHLKYHLYGGRGIFMCEEWRNDFAAFRDHLGPRPSPKHSVDRIDNDRGYEPGNVRWATQKEQMQNAGYVIRARNRKAAQKNSE